MLDNYGIRDYMIESEIDKAFPYLDELNKELSILEKGKTISKKINLLNIFSFFKKTSYDLIANNTKPIKSKTYKKDGYKFIVKFNMKYNESNSKPYYYEIFINIIYSKEKRCKEFYKKFNDIIEARECYKTWEGMFKHLTRRDIMEILFKEKLESIKQLSK